MGEIHGRRRSPFGILNSIEIQLGFVTQKPELVPLEFNAVAPMTNHLLASFVVNQLQHLAPVVFKKRSYREVSVEKRRP